MKIGFIGQGYVGKNTANDFEARGYDVVRYALESEYVENKEHISSCDLVFVAVPTPTTPDGFDYHIVRDSLALVGEGKTVIIKSTLLPGTTKKLQEQYAQLVVLFSPEFLSELTAERDAANPIFNILGLPIDSEEHRSAAELAMEILPKSEHSFIISSDAAELFKYTHNIHGFMRIVFSNLLYDAAATLGVEWSHLEQMMNVNPMMSAFYNSPVHKSGRGAGGNCFIKDMAAFTQMYAELRPHDAKGIAVLDALVNKNLELLAATGKSQELVKGVYGDSKG